MAVHPGKRASPQGPAILHLLAENAETTYIAYVSEQNLLLDDSGEPVSHPQVEELFKGVENGRYIARTTMHH